VLKIHNNTIILPIIHLLFYPESRNMLQGPIYNFFKVWGQNCNFHKLRDQTEILSSSTSNPEFQQKTHCSFQISNSKFTIYTNHNSIIIFTYNLSKSTTQSITNNNQPYNIQINSSINPKQNFQNPNIQPKQKFKVKENILYTLKHKSYPLTYFLQLLSITL
jgi:hypothetical protein